MHFPKRLQITVIQLLRVIAKNQHYQQLKINLILNYRKIHH